MDDATYRSLTAIQNSIDNITDAIEGRPTLEDLGVLLFMLAVTAKKGGKRAKAKDVYNQARELALCHDTMAANDFPLDFDDRTTERDAEK